MLFQPYPNFSSIDLDKRITEISYPKFDINNNPIDGEFINNIGNTASNASYKRTDYIELFKGQFLFKLNFGLNLTRNTSISFYDENKNFVFSITEPTTTSQSYVEQEVDFSEHPNVRYFRATLYGRNLYAFCKKVDSIIIHTDAVTTSKIADNAVTTSKIADGTIQSTDINSNAFDITLKTASKLADAKSVGDAIYNTIIEEIVQNGQLAVLEGNGIERVTETRSGFINKNGNLVEHSHFKTAIINVADNKAYKIYAPQAGSESVINRLHLFAEENGNSPICGSFLKEYNDAFYAIFPPEVKSISITSLTITTLSVLEYDIANSEIYSFFNSKNEELGQTISDVKQTYREVTDTTTEYESVEGVVFNGRIQVISAYPDGFHSKPFWCKRGDVITISNRRNTYALSALYKTDESESFFETLIHGTTSQSYIKEEYYIQEDGWYGVSGRSNSFKFAKKSISDGYILKATSRDGMKKTIDLTITNDDVVIGDAPVCQFIGNRAYSIKGNGNKTISVSLSEIPTGRCFSVGLRIPYATQDVANVTINGLSYPMASSDARTASGKNYNMDGDHYHRYNFDTRYSEINSFDIVVESEADWEIMLSASCIVDDEMDCCPVMIGYDLTEQYNGYFDYNGESINVYELHKRLNIPYYIAIYKGTVITIQEVQDAIDSGLAEVVFYSGGPAMTPLWNKTDGSFAEKLWQDKCAVGIDVDMNVLSQGVIDRNIYRNLKNAGFKILRHLSQDAGKFSAIADKYGDNDMYISYGYGLGTSSVLPNQLRFPLIMYSHGIGVSNIPDDPYYPSHYVDFDGTRTINTLKYLKSQERIGEVKCLKPSDWFSYIKAN